MEKYKTVFKEAKDMSIEEVKKQLLNSGTDVIENIEFLLEWIESYKDRLTYLDKNKTYKNIVKTYENIKSTLENLQKDIFKNIK